MELEEAIKEMKSLSPSAEAIDTVLKELDKKDKVIDLMAEHIQAPIITKEGKLVKAKNYAEVKEYFYKKVEEEK